MFAGFDRCKVSAERQHVSAQQFALGPSRFSPVTSVATAREIPLLTRLSRVRKPSPRPDVIDVEFVTVPALCLSAIPASVAIALANALGSLVPIRWKRWKGIASVLRVSRARMVRGGADDAAECRLVASVPRAPYRSTASSTRENGPSQSTGARRLSRVRGEGSAEGAVLAERGTALERSASPERGTSHYAALLRCGFARINESILRKPRVDWFSSSPA